MAIKVWDGYDHYNTYTDLFARKGFLQYQISGSNNPAIVTPGRNGFGKALQLASSAFSDGLDFIYAQAVASAFVGIAFQPSGVGGGFIAQFRDSSTDTDQCTVMFDPSNYSIAIYRGTTSGTLLYRSANNVWQSRSYNYFEMWPVIDNAAGSFKVWINGVQLVNLTGVDTQQSVNAVWDVMRLVQTYTTASSPTYSFDDHYYGDTTTGPGIAPATSPIGDCRVVTLFPIGNNSVQWTPLAATNWQEVSETAMDSDTSYNLSSTPGQEDQLNFQSMPAGVNMVYGIQITGAYRKDDAGTRTLKQLVKTGGSVYYGSNNNLPDTVYEYLVDQWILNPNTGLNWTVTDINSIAAGYNLVA